MKNIKINDLIQWTINGTDCFITPKKVVKIIVQEQKTTTITEKGADSKNSLQKFVFVEGSDCGIPEDQARLMSEVSNISGLSPELEERMNKVFKEVDNMFKRVSENLNNIFK